MHSHNIFLLSSNVGTNSLFVFWYTKGKSIKQKMALFPFCFCKCAKGKRKKRSDFLYWSLILSNWKAVLSLCHLVKVTMGQLKKHELFSKIIKILHWLYVLKVKRNIEFSLIFHSLVVENRNRKMGQWVLFPFGLFDFTKGINEIQQEKINKLTVRGPSCQSYWQNSWMLCRGRGK